MRAGSAGGGRRLVRSFGAESHETCPAARFTIAAGIKKGEILRGPPFHQRSVFALDDVEPADARADVHAHPLCILRRDFRPDICIASSAAASAK